MSEFTAPYPTGGRHIRLGGFPRRAGTIPRLLVTSADGIRIPLLLQGLHDIEYDYQDKRSDQRAKHQEFAVPSTDQRV
jgi:hypothetical protein